MNFRTLKNQSLCALAISLALHAGSVLAKDFTENQFSTQTLGHGVYELAYDAGQQALYAASAPSFEKDKTAGEVFQLAADSLKVDERITTQRRPFAVSLDDANHILWLGNALDGSVTLLDTRTSKEVKTLQLADAENKAHVREVVLDKKHHRLYVSGIGSEGKGVLWVVDTQNQRLLHALKGMDPVGFAVDEDGDKVYAVTGKGELVTLNGKTSQVLSRVKVDPSEPKHYFLNIAMNTAKGVGFIADTNTADVLVVQLGTGKIVHRVPTPNSIAAVYNAARNEVYVTHRNARQISIIDASNYSLKHTVKTAAMPNSMVLSPDGKTLFVSVKQDEKANKADYVLKLDLTQF
ncbi:YncE family protein [Enterobacter wuhouensis]|uniref:YncE family protein n=1 Tax=Enterobacter wuhouensis TaxID=2529381 RepID=A0A4R0G7S3_9ENTR|nr:YncE family protein [Enterobacter wuhouensis]TCB92910.1 YncE family protein [Enterobacter wuhouensis]